MTARSRDPEATRAAILEAAEEVFLAKGFGNAATSEIARRAGVTKSLIHHHFGSKEGLWEEVKERRFRGYAEAQMAMLDRAEPTAELLRSSMEAYFQFLRHNQQLVRILAWIFLEQQRDGCECIRLDRTLIEAGTAKIAAAQERGELRSDVDPRFILFTMIGVVQHWFQDRAHILEHVDLDGGGGLDDAYLADILKIFFEGILPR